MLAADRRTHQAVTPTFEAAKREPRGSGILSPPASIHQGDEMRAALMSIEEAFVTYSEGMARASQNVELGDLGACRRR
jgi:hypothetical protein